MTKLLFNLNACRQPFGGHHFTELGVTFKGDTFEEVVEQLRDFRVNNGLVVGHPDQDVLCYYMTKWPYLVAEDDKAVLDDETTRFDLWRSWIHATWKNPPKHLVPVKTAQERWKICEDCKFNRKPNWKETDESAELTRRAFMLRRGIDVPDYLGFCAYHGADLGVFTLLEKPLDFSKHEGEFSYCWTNKKENK